jgi:YbgC/YbaW family acyl-CoA thioester hydrolase
MTHPVIYKRKVRYSDSDVQGHVFNANYFVYFDDTITDFMAAVEGSSCGEPTHEIVLARAECDFCSPGKMGETLQTTVTVKKIGNTSITFALEIAEELSGRLIARGVEVYVVVDAATMRPIAVPDQLRSALEKQMRQAGA